MNRMTKYKSMAWFRDRILLIDAYCVVQAEIIPVTSKTIAKHKRASQGLIGGLNGVGKEGGHAS